MAQIEIGGFERQSLAVVEREPESCARSAEDGSPLGALLHYADPE